MPTLLHTITYVYLLLIIEFEKKPGNDILEIHEIQQKQQQKQQHKREKNIQLKKNEEFESKQKPLKQPNDRTIDRPTDSGPGTLVHN